MASIRELATRRRRGQQQLAKPYFMPPPQGGVNAIAPLSAMLPSDAITLNNMIPSRSGLHVRKGYREHCEPVPLGDGIKTLISVETIKSDGTGTPRLFACTSDGIYDVTTAGAAPVKVQDFPVKGTATGWCSWTAFTTAAANFILVCDTANGYYVYNATTNAWTHPAFGVGGVEGCDPSTFDFVMVWKQRVWFCERNSTRAWFLPVGSVLGTVDSVDFGNKFRYGGFLKSLWNWTLDGGEGIDDYLVAVGSAGDMVLYKGTDPKTAGEFNLKGWWFVGKPTEGRRQGGDIGGELMLLTAYGVVQASSLVSGLPITNEQASISAKINPAINQMLSRGVTGAGWMLKLHPREQILLVITPKELGRPYVQFCYNTATRAWSTLTGLPMKSAEVWQGDLYFGADDNRIYVYDGYSDRVMLDDDGESATAVEWEALTSYQGLGIPSNIKCVQFLRPLFVANTPPTFTVQARYDFDITQVPGSPAYVPPSGSLWDSGLWGTAVWGGGRIVNAPPAGAFGMGRHVAVAMRGRSSTETIFVGIDVILTVGGLL